MLAQTLNRTIVNMIEAPHETAIFSYDVYADPTCPACEHDADNCICKSPIAPIATRYGWCTEDSEDHLNFATAEAAAQNAIGTYADIAADFS